MRGPFHQTFILYLYTNYLKNRMQIYTVLSLTSGTKGRLTRKRKNKEKRTTASDFMAHPVTPGDFIRSTDPKHGLICGTFLVISLWSSIPVAVALLIVICNRNIVHFNLASFSTVLCNSSLVKLQI